MISSIAFLLFDLGSGGAERVVASLALGLRRDVRTCVFVRRGARRHHDLQDVPVIEVDMTAEGILAAVATHRIDLILDHYHWNAAHVRMMAGLADQWLRIVLTEHNAFHYRRFRPRVAMGRDMFRGKICGLIPAMGFTPNSAP